MTVDLEGFIGGSIDRVFNMYAKALVLCEVGVRQQYRPVAFREVALEHRETAVCLGSTSLSRIEQEEVVPCLVVMFVVGILAGQTT